MSQFRTSSDLADSVLRRCNELTSGTSPYESQVIDYLNQIHHTVIVGGSEFDLDVDEPWVWAKARHPLILELQPKHNTGSVSLTQGSEAGTFSSAPSSSLQGWFLRVIGKPEVLRIASHTAAATAFELDSAYPGDTNATASYEAFKLDYELTPDYIIIDSENNRLDFGVTSTSTETTATLTDGTYTPSALATHVAARLQVADASRTYSGSYDTVTRKFSFTSNLASSATFKPFGAGTNAHRSGWATLGFDYENLTTAATQTSVNPLGSVVRLLGPGRVYWGGTSGQIEGIDSLTLDRDYPLARVGERVPTHFAKIREKADGTTVVRFNGYPDRKLRVEFEHIPVPLDLKDNSASVPLIPRKFSRVLEFGACFYLLTDKNDKKAQAYYQIARGTLQGMLKMNRKELQRIGPSFGQIIARPDLVANLPDRRNAYGYDSGEY